MIRNKNSRTTIVAMFVSAALLIGALGVPAAAVDIRTVTVADATNQATGQALYSGSITFYGERFTNPSNIVLIEVDSVQLSLRKVGSPTGNLEVGFYDTNRNLIQSFGTKDVSTLTTSYTSYTFNLSGTGHLIQKDTILAVTYSGGDASNKVDARRSNVGDGTDPDYDGIDSYLSYYDGSWHNYNSATTGRDLLFKLTNTFDKDLSGSQYADSACDQLTEDGAIYRSPALFWRDEGRCDTGQEFNYRKIWGQEVTADTVFKVRVYHYYGNANPSQELRGDRSELRYCQAQFVDDRYWACSGAATALTDQYSDQDGYSEWSVTLTDNSGKYLAYAPVQDPVYAQTGSPLTPVDFDETGEDYAILMDTD